MAAVPRRGLIGTTWLAQAALLALDREGTRERTRNPRRVPIFSRRSACAATGASLARTLELVWAAPQAGASRGGDPPASGRHARRPRRPPCAELGRSGSRLL